MLFFLQQASNTCAICAVCGCQGVKSLVVGFPGGKVCTEQHIPGYASAEVQAELKKAGVDKVVAVTVSSDPQAVHTWAAQHGFDKAGMVSVFSSTTPLD